MNQNRARWICWCHAIVLALAAATATILHWVDTLTLPPNSIAWTLLAIGLLTWGGYQAGARRRVDTRYLADLAEAVHIGRELARRESRR